MPEEAKVPLVGRTGLMFVVGAIIGVVFDWFLASAAEKQPMLATPIYGEFHVDDLIALAVPLVLLFVIKRFRVFFIGMFVGALACEVKEWIAPVRVF